MAKMLVTLTAIATPSRSPSDHVMVHSDSRCQPLQLVSAFATEGAAAVTFAEQKEPTEHTTNLDSHTRTRIAGKNVLVIHVLDKKVNGAGFDPAQGKVKDASLISVALGRM
jgi:hypothetical protein